MNLLKKIHTGPRKIALIFLLLGMLWVVFSEQIVFYLFKTSAHLNLILILNDWLFVLVTAIFIYVFISKEISAKEELITLLNKKQEWHNLLIANLPNTNVYLFDTHKELLFKDGSIPLDILTKPQEIIIKDLDNYCKSGTKQISFMRSINRVLDGQRLEMGVKVEGVFVEMHGVPIVDNNKVIAALIIVFNREPYRNLVLEASKERESFAKLSEKYHSLNKELEDSYNRLKTYNKELEENKERYSAFIQQNSEAVYRFDIKKAIANSLPPNDLSEVILKTAYLAEFNPSFAQIYELDDSLNYIGKSIYDIFPESNHVQTQELIKNLVKYEYRLKNHETVEQDAKGRTRYFLNNIIGVVENGKLVRFWGTKLETTQQKMYERDLIQAKKSAEQSDRLKTAFLANMSHEIRTPLNGILGFSELLCHTELPGEKRQKYMGIIQASNNQLLRIINDILDISRIETNLLTIAKSKFSINQLFNDIEPALKHEIKQKKKNIELIINKELDNGKDQIFTDKERLYQVIMNLASNAVKFTETGSVILSYSVKNNSIIEFRVEDTGIGIADEYLTSIFDQFRQVEDFAARNYGGTGLGLSISKGIVELLGGYISVESESKQGSSFKFTIKYV